MYGRVIVLGSILLGLCVSSSALAQLPRGPRAAPSRSVSSLAAKARHHARVRPALRSQLRDVQRATLVAPHDAARRARQLDTARLGLRERFEVAVAQTRANAAEQQQLRRHLRSAEIDVAQTADPSQPYRSLYAALEAFSPVRGQRELSSALANPDRSTRRLLRRLDQRMTEYVIVQLEGRDPRMPRAEQKRLAFFNIELMRETGLFGNSRALRRAESRAILHMVEYAEQALGRSGNPGEYGREQMGLARGLLRDLQPHYAEHSAVMQLATRLQRREQLQRERAPR